MKCNARTACLLLAMLTLAGCDNTSIAFCSGSDEFCGDFFDNAPNNDDEEEPPEDNAPAFDETALAIAKATPSAVTSAIAQQSMAQLTQQDPEVVGLWLTAATLGHLHTPENLPISEFLDQNRAWLTGQTSSETASLVAGLSLFAAFSAQRDPALAELAEPQHKLQPVEISAENRSAISSQVDVILRSADANACCQPAELAAAAIALCPTTPEENRALNAAVTAACANAENWLANSTGLGNSASAND